MLLKRFINILLLDVLLCIGVMSQDSLRLDFEKKHFVEVGLVSNGLGLKIGYEPNQKINLALLLSALHPAIGGAVTVKPFKFIFVEGMISYIQFPKNAPIVTSTTIYSDDITAIDSGLKNLVYGWRIGGLIPVSPKKEVFDIALSIGRVKSFSQDEPLNHDYQLFCVGVVIKF